MRPPRMTQVQKTVRVIEQGWTVGGGPVGEGRDGVAGETLVEFDGDEDSAQNCSQTGSDGRQDEDGEQQSENSGEEAGEL